MTEYVLDVSKWRCGGVGEFRMGEGTTVMENGRGFSCCLGQFAKQKGIDWHGRCCRTPRNVASYLGYSYDDNFVSEYRSGSGVRYYDTDLARTLININDYHATTPREKVSQIRELLEKHGHTLKVLNEEMLDEGHRD